MAQRCDGIAEDVVTFGPGLVGVLTRPAGTRRPPSPLGFVLVGAGLLHSVGPNRLYVRISRRLATRGHVVFRYDAAGIGDSPAPSGSDETGHDPGRETEAAFELVRAKTGASRFALIGVCSGATLAFQTAVKNECTVGLALANVDVGGFDVALDDELKWRQARRYYGAIALMRSRSWRRFLTGRSNYAKILGSIGHAWKVRQDRLPHQPWAGQLADDLARLNQRSAELLIIASETDTSADYVAVVRRAIPPAVLATRAALHILRDADHTFTLKAHQAELLRLLESWADRVGAKQASRAV
jgi:alpha-beta hydrolase superfamily lysophospholipase